MVQSFGRRAQELSLVVLTGGSRYERWDPTTWGLPLVCLIGAYSGSMSVNPLKNPEVSNSAEAVCG